MRGQCCALVVMLTFAGAARAQQPASTHDRHAMPSGSHAGHATGSRTPATEAYEAASTRMHKDMAIADTGDADADFLRSMIPHHRGAVDMARALARPRSAGAQTGRADRRGPGA